MKFQYLDEINGPFHEADMARTETYVGNWLTKDKCKIRYYHSTAQLL